MKYSAHRESEKGLRSRVEVLLLVLSLSLGLMGTCLYGRYAKEPGPVRVEQAAWWCGLYPELYQPAEDQGSPRIQFKYLTFLNGRLDR